MNKLIYKVSFVLILALYILGISTISCAIPPIDVLNINLSSTSYMYNGKEIKPNVTIKLNGKEDSQSNYNITYSNCVNVGTAKVTVSSKRNPNLTKSTSYQIIPYPHTYTNIVDVSDVWKGVIYDGKEHKPTFSITGPYNVKLVYGVDYTLSVKDENGGNDLTNVGTKYWKITYKGNYTGSNSGSYIITKVDSSNISVKLNATSFTYNGKVQKPTVTVTDTKNKRTLKNKTDYDLSIQVIQLADSTKYDNLTFKDVGEYQITVAMKGNYSGQLFSTYTINPKQLVLTDFTIKKSFNYTPDTDISNPDKFLNNCISSINNSNVAKKDYTIKFKNPTRNNSLIDDVTGKITGNRKIVITGKNNYSGSLEYTVTINQFDVSKCNTSAPKLILLKLSTYNGKKTIWFGPKYQFIYNDKEIDSGYMFGEYEYFWEYNPGTNKYTKDKVQYSNIHNFDVTYIYDVNKSTFKVILKGCDDFKGTKSITMKVIDENKEYKKGDANGDGKINSEDARLVLRMSVGMETIVPAADMNSDRKVTSEDARLILRKSVNLK